MTSFNSPAVLMPLDEYYDECVQPKPDIPARYPGFSGKKKRRQAARLQSYKDNNGEEDDEDEFDDDGEEEGEEEEEYNFSNEVKVDEQHFDKFNSTIQDCIDEFEFNSSIQDSTNSQLDFEMNEFNQIFAETDDLMGESVQNTMSKVTEIPAGSAQWRIQPNNVNRPLGAAPLVPSDAPRGKLKPVGGRAGRGKNFQKFQQQRGGYNRFGTNNINNNNRPNSVHNRLGYNRGHNSQRGRPMAQRMRNGYNAFSNNNNANNNTANQQQQVLMNINNHFQKSQPQVRKPSTSTAPIQSNVNNLLNLIGNQLNSNTNEPSANSLYNLIRNQLNSNTNDNLNNLIGTQLSSYTNESSSNSINNLIGTQLNSYANETNSNSINNLMGTQLSSISSEFTSNNLIKSNTLASLINSANQMANTNAFARLGPAPPQNKSTDLGVCQTMVQPPGNTQLQPGTNLDTLRLADLMNIDQNKMNGREVANCAVFLLSSAYHKPILDGDVQQELSELQQKSGMPEAEPNGVDMVINPESTDLPMYHRFK